MDSKLEYDGYIMDPTYEVDAPQFFDFEWLLKHEMSVIDFGDDDGDSWFEKNEAVHETSVEDQSDSIKNCSKSSPNDSSTALQASTKMSVFEPVQAKIGNCTIVIQCLTTVNESFAQQVNISQSVVHSSATKCDETEHEICSRVEKLNICRRSRSLDNRALPKIVPKKLTIPRSPNLHTAARNQERQSNESLCKSSTKTQSQSPNEKSKIGRSNSSIRHDKKVKDPAETLTFLVPNGKMGAPLHSNAKRCVTTPKPFSFQNREDEFLEKRKKLIQENEIKFENEKVKRQFKARSIPKSPVLSTMVAQKSRTRLIVKPFKFKTDEIHAEYERRLKEKQLLIEEQRRKMLNFRAQPAKVLHQAPFKPKASEHTKLVPKQIQFNTEKRAGEWQKFDCHLKEKEHEKMKILKQRQLEKEEEEKLQIQEMRRLAVHRAQPVKHYKNVDPRPPPTVTFPESPLFKTDERFKKRQH